MPARIEVAPELIAEGKHLYEETLIPTDEIGARMGLSRSAFYLRVKEWKWKRRRYSTGIAEDAAKTSEPLPRPTRAQRRRQSRHSPLPSVCSVCSTANWR